MDNVLIAREGYVYTNGITFASIIRLGINDNKDNWREIAIEEAETLQNIEQEGDIYVE
jgi:hypothetical protein